MSQIVSGLLPRDHSVVVGPSQLLAACAQKFFEARPLAVGCEYASLPEVLEQALKRRERQEEQTSMGERAKLLCDSTHRERCHHSAVGLLPPVGHHFPIILNRRHRQDIILP